jgi:hypothetical protein
MERLERELFIEKENPGESRRRITLDRVREPWRM